LLRRGFARELLHRTGNAYDPVFPLPGPDPASPGRLFFIGRLVDQKGVWDVIELARRLQAAGSPLQIDLVGDGPLRGQIDAAVARDDLGNVHVLGLVDERDKWTRLSASLLCLAPSREEGWGIAVGEALLAGVPVIARDLPAYHHFPDGIISAVEDGVDFVEAAFRLANSPQEIARMADRTRQVASQLPRWEAIIGDELEILHGVEVVKGHSGNVR